MQNLPLDHRTHTINSIKESLIKAGITNMYAHQKGYVIVKGTYGDSVKVQINLDAHGTATVQKKFPQIGSGPQVLATIFFLIIGFSGFLPFPFISAIILGQLVSFLWFYPKIQLLKKTVESIIFDEVA
ncbi:MULTISPECIES: hypothetical protein [unclassified Aureispira]|uniref:hypothetical protein n=1 Tax=unclassified Aureispira TaxID=2649989 RepID=UPI0006983EEC|nr:MULTISPECIES: hypothetical protein [unclassified Aureispira]WMX13873.1 hypothetical protein QP953_23760 [Aureispira sp. CCB-E]